MQRRSLSRPRGQGAECLSLDHALIQPQCPLELPVISELAKGCLPITSPHAEHHQDSFTRTRGGLIQHLRSSEHGAGHFGGLSLSCRCFQTHVPRDCGGGLLRGSRMQCCRHVRPWGWAWEAWGHLVGWKAARLQGP